MDHGNLIKWIICHATISIDELARITPVNPPIVKITTNPTAHKIAKVFGRMFISYILLAIQLFTRKTYLFLK